MKISEIDVDSLFNEVERDGQSGKINQYLLIQCQAIYGINKAYPEYLEQITPDGRTTMDHFKKWLV